MTAELDCSALMRAQAQSWLAWPGRVLSFCTGKMAQDFLFHEWKLCKGTCTAGASVQTCSAGLETSGAGVSTNLQHPLPCTSLSKDPSSVASISAMDSTHISLLSILTRREGKKGRSCLKPWLHTALVSVHLCPHKHVPAMCFPVCGVMGSCARLCCADLGAQCL